MNSSFKKTIKKTFVGRFTISILHCIECKILPKLQSDEDAVKKYYYSYTKEEANLQNPQKFSEKLQWYKINHKDPLMQKCADKVAVREYVKSKGYEMLLNDLYGVYQKVSEIPFDTLPKQYVMKTSHGSAQIIIVKDKDKLNIFESKMMLWSWLHQDIYWCGREWVYKDIPRRIVVEKYLEDESGDLTDYKFFCFNGKPKFMQLEIGRFSDNHYRNFYDMDWKLLPFGKGLPYNDKVDVPKPLMFEQMKKIASDLCKDFQFVRVDLYQANGKIYFGELTFFPAGGMPNFKPPEYDQIVGDLWDIER